MFASNPWDKTSFTILGVDPGSETMGYGVLKVDTETLKITDASAFTIKGSRSQHMRQWDSDLYSDQIARIRAHQVEFLRVLNEVDPDVVICESAFYNRLRPNAYEVLVRVQTMLRDTLSKWDCWRELYLIDPPTAKKSFGAAGNAKKEAMLAALKANPELNHFPGILELDEHSVDALAVGHHYYKHIQKSRL